MQVAKLTLKACRSIFKTADLQYSMEGKPDLSAIERENKHYYYFTKSVNALFVILGDTAVRFCCYDDMLDSDK